MDPLVVILVTFAVLLFLGMPIIYCMGIAAMAYCISTGKLLLMLIATEKIFRGMDSFVLLAIPMFILCGEIMNRGGITRTLVRFADLLVGRIRGGLAYVNTLASTFFAGITGSALSDVASIGSILIPTMEEQGYSKDFSCAVTAATAIQGPLIPPSIPAVLVASATGLSTGALFWGGAVPGLLIGLGAAFVIAISSRFHKYPKRTEKIPFREAINITLHSLLPLMTVVIILVGMTSGLFTPTEAAAVALVYSLVVTSIMYKPIKFREMVDIGKSVIVQTGTIYLIIGCASAFAWALALENVPSYLSTFITSFAHSKLGVLLVLNIVLLIWGMFMDTAPSILVLVPILLPVATAAGVHPIHFGVLVIVNLMIGLLTPPFGMALYATQSVGKCSLGGLIKNVVPFLLVDLVMLAVITLVPDLVLALPRAFGLAQ
ncbi:MAG TPA: TRAP transporter large permease [Eubacteriales bacterium]|nr:TRAP transporter large permease [Eubacteriales bacterium]